MKRNLTKWVTYCCLISVIVFLSSCQQDHELIFETEEIQIAPRLSFPELPDFTVPIDAIPIQENTIFIPGAEYIIDGVFSGNIPFYGNTGERITLYVTGLWDVLNWNLETGMDVVIMPGGTLTSTTNSSMVVNGESNIYITEGASANFTNGFFYLSNNGSINVFGDLFAQNLQINSGTFTIGETGTAIIGSLADNAELQQELLDLLNEDERYQNYGVVRIIGFDNGNPANSQVSTTQYNAIYVPGQIRYVLNANYISTTTPQRVSDKEGFGATLSTAEGTGALVLFLPVGKEPDTLPKRLTFEIESVLGVVEVVQVVLR